MIKFKIALLTASAVLLGATAVNAESWKRIKTDTDFKSLVAGKTLSGDLGTATVKANGTGSGKTPKGRYKINWVWDHGRYCRNFRFGNNKPTGTVCAYIDVAGNQVRFSNTNGDKSVSVWTMK